MRNISDLDNLIRYASPTKFNLQMMQPSSEFFQLKINKNETYLSCFWLEFRNCDISLIEEDIKNHLKVNVKGRYFQISIAKLKEIAAPFGRTDILYKGPDSYCGIHPKPPRILIDEERLLRELKKTIVNNYRVSV